MRYDAVAFLESLFQPSAIVDTASNRPAGPAPVPSTGMALVDLPPEWHIAWDERAAILEYDGCLAREQAEAVALAEIERQMRSVFTPCSY